MTNAEKRCAAAAEALHNQLEQKFGSNLISVGYAHSPARLSVYVRCHEHAKLVPGRFKNITVETRIVGYVRPGVREIKA